MIAVVDKTRLDQLEAGDVLFFTLPVGQWNILIQPDPEGYGKAHRAKTIEKLAERGITVVPKTGLGKLTWFDVTPTGANLKVFSITYALTLTRIDGAEKFEPLRAGFPIVGILFGIAAVGLAFGLFKESAELVDVLEGAAPPLAFGFAVLSVAALWWVATR